MASNKQQQADQEFDPKYEWQENAANYVLRVHLSGFRKEDFRVQVDGAGRLTVRGQRADGGGKHVRFHKVFQLPPTSNLDDISGRFDAGVLALTVPKRPAPPPATIDDIRKPKKEEKAETKPTPPPQAESKDEAAKKEPETKKKAEHEQLKEAETKKKLEEKQHETKKKPEEKKAEHEQHKEAETKNKAEEKQLETRKKAAEEDAKKKAAAAADHKIKDAVETKKKAAADDKIKPEVEAKAEPKQTETKAGESLLESVRRRAAAEEEERAKAAEDQRKKQSGCGGWKERVAEELQGLRSSEWAEGAVETIKKNKEVIATAVAAFSLGLFVSSRLFSRN